MSERLDNIDDAHMLAFAEDGMRWWVSRFLAELQVYVEAAQRSGQSLDVLLLYMMQARLNDWQVSAEIERASLEKRMDDMMRDTNKRWQKWDEAARHPPDGDEWKPPA